MTKHNKLKPGPQLGYIVVFGASDWQQVEKAYGQTLPDRARKLISVATLPLTLSIAIERNAPKIGGKNSDVLDEIERLIGQAELLREKLYPPHHWSEEYRTDETPRRLDRRLEMELEAIGDKPHNESDILRICLTGLIESGCKFLRHADEHAIHEGDAWNAWVVWITLIVQAFKLPFGIRESDVYRVTKKDDRYREIMPSRFVELIKALQAIACPHYRRSTTDGGLAKAIARARRSIKVPPNFYIGGSPGTDELERELLKGFNIKAYAQLSVRELSPLQEAVKMVIDNARPGIHPFIPQPLHSSQK
jgi:hypothetical protein